LVGVWEPQGTHYPRTEIKEKNELRGNKGVVKRKPVRGKKRWVERGKASGGAPQGRSQKGF